VNFDLAFQKLVGNEGGYVSNAADPGGQTKYGISKRSYPGEDIPNLTLERAKQIYAHDFWGPAGCDALPDALKFEMFDTAVNVGVRTAVKLLQMAVGSFPDGILGPNTLQCAQSMDPAKALRRLQGQRLRYYAGMVTWPAFGKGWVNRVADNMLEA
jgi:lysozyme family protein